MSTFLNEQDTREHLSKFLLQNAPKPQAESTPIGSLHMSNETSLKLINVEQFKNQSFLGLSDATFEVYKAAHGFDSKNHGNFDRI